MCWTPDPWQIRDEKSHLSQGSVLVSDRSILWGGVGYDGAHKCVRRAHL